MLEQMILDLRDKGVKLEDAIAGAKGVDFRDPEQATAYYRKFVRPTAGDWIDLVRYNSMLSGPQTHSNNAFNNLMQGAVVAPLRLVVAGMADAVRSVLGGGGSASPARTQFATEAAPYIKPYATSLRPPTQNFADSMRGKIPN